MNDPQNEVDVFLAALEIDAPDSRAAYLDAACNENDQLRQRVEALLRRHLESKGVLDAPPPGLVATIELPPITERPGTVIGPYKLLQQIGEGGMGVVFMAEQTEPIQRTVALKIIKPGMDTRQVIARFEAERQAVAMMDHPNIAKVLDAGTTGVGQAFQPDTLTLGNQHTSQAGKPVLHFGRPYFVMELVKGVPITKYCDEKHLPLRARLELFVQVCQAVQHAHQKGIIHRDIKPNNVLVAEYDNHAVPKVIDFGVAKATAQRLTERTMFTEFGQVLGTMEYMSPEQAKLNQLDIDTRSDIYSLGVLLYELLTGSTPFEQKRLREAAFDEVLRIIREEEPPKPSTKLSTSDTLPSVAANRHTEPARLSKDIRGELDWIVMKCLEKDRNRRFETANGLARDIERYLHDEPVQAGPPSAAYRFRKFARRNKAAFLAVTAAFATLLLLVIGLAIANRLISAQRDEKIRALAGKDQALALAEAQRLLAYYLDALHYHRVAETRDIEGLYRGVSDQLDRAENLSSNPQPLGPVPLPASVGHRQRDLAFILRNAGRLEEAEQTFRRAVRTFEKLREQNPSSDEHWQYLAASHREVGLVLIDRNKPEEAEQEFRRAIEIYSEIIASKPDMAEAWGGRGHCYVAKGEFAKAAEEFSAAIKLKPDRSDAWTGRAFTYLHRQQWDQAVADYTKAIELAPEVHTNWFHRGLLYLQLAQWDKAAADFSKLLEQWPYDSGGWFSLAAAHAQLNQSSEALFDLRQAIANGFNDIEHLKTYPTLDPIRSHPDFKKLVAELEGKKK